MVSELWRALNEKYPDVEFAFNTDGMHSAVLNMGELSPIQLQIQASDLDQGQEITGTVIDAAWGVDGHRRIHPLVLAPEIAKREWHLVTAATPLN